MGYPILTLGPCAWEFSGCPRLDPILSDKKQPQKPWCLVEDLEMKSYTYMLHIYIYAYNNKIDIISLIYLYFLWARRMGMQQKKWIYIYRAGICSIQYLANQKTVKTQIQNMQIHWLVVEPYPSEKWWSEFVSWDDDIPNIMGKIIHPCSKPPTSIIIDLLSPYKDILSPIICRFIIKVIVFFMFLPKKIWHISRFSSRHPPTGLPGAEPRLPSYSSLPCLGRGMFAPLTC